MPATKAITFVAHMPIDRIAVRQFCLGPRFGYRLEIYHGVEITGVPSCKPFWNEKMQLWEERFDLMCSDGSVVMSLPYRWFRVKGEEEN